MFRVFDVYVYFSYVLILLNILLKNICMAILQSLYRNAIRVIIYFILFFFFSKSYGICCSCRRGGSVVCEIVNQYLHLFFFLGVQNDRKTTNWEL